jgi:hypothetical protein
MVTEAEREAGARDESGFVSRHAFLKTQNSLIGERGRAMSIPAWVIGLLDDSVRADVRRLQDNSFHWLLGCTMLVAVGVVLEGLEHSQHLFGAAAFRIDPFNGIPHIVKRRAPNFVKGIVIFGWFLVAIGVAGEFVCDALISQADEVVQTLNEILLNEGRTEAARANEHAWQLERDNLILRTDLERIRKAGEPRRLTTVQAERLRRVLHGYTASLVILFAPFDLEAADFAADFADAFSKSKWEAKMEPYGRPGYGVSVGGPRIERLRSALSAIGVASQILAPTELPTPKMLYLMVGTRPSVTSIANAK